MPMDMSEQNTPSIYAQVEAGTLATPKTQTVASSSWFDDTMLNSVTLPKIKVQGVTASSALAIYSYLYAGDSSPHVRSLTPKIIGLLAHHCLLRKGSLIRMFTMVAETPPYSIDTAYQDINLSSLADRIRDPNSHASLPAPVLSIIQDHQLAAPQEINGDLLAQIHKEEDILRYIGALSFMLIRLGVKTPEMIQKYYENKFHSVYAGVYGRPKINLPLLKLESLREIAVTYNNGDPIYKMLVLNATQISYDAMSDIDKGADGTVLRGLAMIVVANHSLPLYNWAERVGEKVEKTPLEVMSMIRCGQTHKSVANMFSFVYAYMATDEEYLKISAVREAYGIPEQKKSIYWPVSRIMNSNFLTIVGRKGNEDAINILIEIYNRYATTDEKIVDGTYKVPKGKLDPSAPRTIARAFSSAIDREMSTYETSNTLSGLRIFGGADNDIDADGDQAMAQDDDEESMNAF